MFQSGISLSICLRAPNITCGLTHPRPGFQSGISLSICLHYFSMDTRALARFIPVSIRHQPEYLPSLRLGSEDPKCQYYSFNQASA